MNRPYLDSIILFLRNGGDNAREKLLHARMRVSDMDETIRFYTQVLGLVTRFTLGVHHVFF
jgi:catechol-2,3-dioxygenase